MYADDTVFLAASTDDLQKNLNIFNIYCEAWKLSINCSKSKVVIFSKRKMKNPPVFTLSDEVIEIVDSYLYLGLIMNYNGSFVKAKTKLINQARRALFAVYRRIKNQPIPVDLQLKLFESLVEPILLYGSEVWGFENTCSLEKMHLQFCKKILQVRETTPSYMIYGELGCYPLSIKIKLRIISYWNRLISNENKLSSKLYKLHMNGTTNFKWISLFKVYLMILAELCI